MDIIKKCRYVNTGGHCYVMFGNVETGEVGNPNGAWFAMSVDADVEPIIQFYETEEDAYNCDGEHGFIREVRESDHELWNGIEWMPEFCKEAFRYVIENGKGAERIMAMYDAEKYFGMVYDII